MGFFDKIKSMKNAMTGGGAKVHVEVGNATLAGPFPVKVTAMIDDADIKIDAVYLLVRAVEEVKVEGASVTRQVREKLGDAVESVSFGMIEDDEETCDIRVNIDGPQELKAGETYTFEGEVTLPQGSRPSFEGRKCRHTWTIQAGLDAFGNDPDSGWVRFTVTG